MFRRAVLSARETAAGAIGQWVLLAESTCMVAGLLADSFEYPVLVRFNHP